MGRRLGGIDSTVGVETLEPRLLMSGNVTATVADGDVLVRGGRADNAVVVDQDGLADGQIRLVGVDGTTINGQAEVILDDVVGALAFDLRGGDDAVTLDGVTLPGDLTVLGGRGDNAVVLTDVDIAGDVTVRNRRGADTFELTGASRIGDDLTIDNRSGGATTTITGVSDDGDPPAITPVEIGGDVSLRNRRGATTTTLEHVTVGGEVGVRNARGVDVLELLGQTRIGGDLTIDHGPGDSTTRLEGLDALTRVGVEDFAFFGRSGDDILRMKHVTFDGDLDIRMGRGADGAEFRSTDVLGDVLFVGGPGADYASIQDREQGMGDTYCWFFGEARFEFGVGRDGFGFGMAGLMTPGPAGGLYFRNGVDVDGGRGEDVWIHSMSAADGGYVYESMEVHLTADLIF